ncbi:MAG TPA: RNA polymerase sigma factor [Chthonomonadaceae bacterium]|nr:RNA polymerase sigma factor [Chthonomonadaceae bacterium]
MLSLEGWRLVNDPNPLLIAEDDLLRAGRAGDLQALERLLTAYERPLFVLCRGTLGHTDDAEDAVQETFLRALRALSGFRGESSLRTWLFRIAIHVCLDWKRARRPMEPWQDTERLLALSAPSPEAGVLRQLRVLEALQVLQPRHRLLVLLKEAEGWSLAEIAAALRWNEKRVQNELFKARRALAAWRQREDAEGEKI